MGAAGRLAPACGLAILLGMAALLGAVVVEAVEGSNFRRCAESAFCARQRSFADKHYARTSSWAVEGSRRGADAVRLSPDRLEASFTITDRKGKASLSAVVRIFDDGRIVRLLVDEPYREQGGGRRRFRPPSGSVLTIDGKASHDSATPSAIHHVSQEGDGSIVMRGEGGKQASHVRLTLDPFSLAVEPLGGDGGRHQDGGAIVVNGSGLFSFEAPAAPRKAEEETFRKWTDYQRHGKQSVACDVAFAGASHLYGIPEHASSMALKATISRTAGGGGLPISDPYRLYNLDVFAYDLDSEMALYGAIPFMMAPLGGSHTGGPLPPAGRQEAPIVGAAFWNNPSETWIDVLLGGARRERTAHFMSESGVLDLVLLVGPSPAAVLSSYYRVTGPPLMPPLFAIAYHQSRWNYVDAADVLDVSKSFSAHQIPLDVIWLDIEYTDRKMYFTWHPRAFADPVALQESLWRESERRLVAIIDPHMKKDTSYSCYRELIEGAQEAAAKMGRPKTGQERIRTSLAVLDRNGIVFEGDCWPGRSIWPDFMRDEVQEWWAEHFSATTASGHTMEKVHIWNDMNEPSVFSGPEVTMPKDALHLGGTVEHRDLHNMYGHMMARATHSGLLGRAGAAEGAQAQRARERPFVLTRSFYASSQRWAAAWTGDNAACWGHLRATLPMLLSLSLAGMPFVGADVGGFFGNPSGELLARWYQAGALQPFFRAHCHMDAARREPYLIEEPFRALIIDAIRLRYALLPYLYTLFRRSSSSSASSTFSLMHAVLDDDASAPPMRPMFFAFPGVAEVDDQYMLGDALLVKPITEEGATTVTVHLPALSYGGRGARELWYEYPSLRPAVPAAADGSSYVMASIDLGTIPIFIRGGRLILRRDRVRLSSGSMRYDPYTIVIAPSFPAMERRIGEEELAEEAAALIVASGHFYGDDGTTDANVVHGEYFEGRIGVTEEDGGRALVIRSHASHCGGGGDAGRVGGLPRTISTAVERIIVGGLGRHGSATVRAVRRSRRPAASEGGPQGGSRPTLDEPLSYGQDDFSLIIGKAGVSLCDAGWAITVALDRAWGAPEAAAHWKEPSAERALEL